MTQYTDALSVASLSQAKVLYAKFILKLYYEKDSPRTQFVIKIPIKLENEMKLIS